VIRSGRRSHDQPPALSAVVAAGLLPAVPVLAAAPPAAGAAEDAGLRSARVTPLVPRPGAVAEQSQTDAWRPSPVARPEPGSALVDLPAQAGAGVPGGRVRAPGLPVSVGRGASPSAPTRVRAEVLAPEVATRLGVPGMVLRLSRVDGGVGAGPVSVEVDYSGLRDAFGGDWARRLTLLRLPACAATAPERADCQAAHPIPGVRNNGPAGTLTGLVDVAPAQRPAADDAEPDLLAVTAAVSSPDTGTFARTSLTQGQSWQAGVSGAGFTWSYPLRMPPGLGGDEPEVELGYSSSMIDARTNGENAQTSWLGEGWDFWPGYIERTYRTCSDDTQDATYPSTTGDQCWRDQNASLVWGDKATELVLDDATSSWRLADDDGSRLELLTGAANGDNDGEYWRLTTTDGTQYFFGRHRLPGWVSGKPVTDSVWTAPVFGNHATDPCYKTGGFAGSWCTQAYRWNLDYVVDPRGNSTSYWYVRESNRTALAGKASTTTPYDRGGYLARIDYGTRAGTEYTANAPARVVLGAADRCLTTACGTHDGTNWPDTPWDLACTASSCANNLSPSFWGTKRLATVTTQVWTGSGTTYRAVDEWKIGHSFPSPTDGTSPSLWLTSITHTGKVGGSTTLPAVLMYGTRFANRTDLYRTRTLHYRRKDADGNWEYRTSEEKQQRARWVISLRWVGSQTITTGWRDADASFYGDG
jgi:hypothetical protein